MHRGMQGSHTSIEKVIQSLVTTLKCHQHFLNGPHHSTELHTMQDAIIVSSYLQIAQSPFRQPDCLFLSRKYHINGPLLKLLGIFVHHLFYRLAHRKVQLTVT